MMSIKKSLFILLFLLSSIAAFNQNCLFSGKIVDQKGNAIPYSSLYIKELGKGGMANLEGSFSIAIPCGNYQLSAQSLGFKTKSIPIEVKKNNEDLTITLTQVAYQLEEVNIDPSSEDPAYNIIRQATVMAQYYQKQIHAYKTKLYIRSFYAVNDLPWIAEKMAPDEDLKELKTGNISETLLEYSFQKPNIVKEKILARKTGDSDTSKTGSNYINLNFYNLGGTQMVNPLSRGAFRVYEFEYINSYFEEGRKIHKIEIIPKRRGDDLMKGFIHINDKIWNIHTVDVQIEQTIGKIDYLQFYKEVDDYVWMPVNHKIKVNVEFMGFKSDIQYLATLSEVEVETDSIIDKKIRQHIDQYRDEFEDTTTSNNPASEVKKQSKTEEKIEELIEKDKLTNRETYKLVRLIKKQAAETEKEDSIKSLEVSKNYKLEYEDSAFKKNDSLWSKGRNVPLSSKEKSIYVARDSLNKVESGDTVINEDRSIIGNIFFYEGSIQSKNKRRIFQPKGILSGLGGYFNTVDGFTIEKKLFRYEWSNRKGKFYELEPTLGYAFSREIFVGEVDFNAQYHMEKRAGFSIKGGRTTADFNSESPMPDFLTTVSTLFFTENYPKFFQEEFVDFNHHFDITNGLVLETGFRYANRQQLKNNSNYKLLNFRNKEYGPNFPLNEQTISQPQITDDHQSSVATIRLSYTPRQYFTYRNNRKVMLSSKFPTFGLKYQHGIDELLGSQSDFSRLSFSVEQSFSYRLINKISYYAEGGRFIHKNQLYFADYKNFNASPFYVMNNSAPNSFMLLNYYSYNSNDYYFQGNFSIEDNHILLKYLPLLNKTNLTEKLHLNYLRTELNKNYYEMGYSLNRIFLLLNIGVFTSFEDEKFRSVGFRIGLNLNNQ